MIDGYEEMMRKHKEKRALEMEPFKKRFYEDTNKLWKIGEQYLLSTGDVVSIKNTYKKIKDGMYLVVSCSNDEKVKKYIDMFGIEFEKDDMPMLPYSSKELCLRKLNEDNKIESSVKYNFPFQRDVCKSKAEYNYNLEHPTIQRIDIPDLSGIIDYFSAKLFMEQAFLYGNHGKDVSFYSYVLDYVISGEKKIEPIYCSDSNITFVMENTYRNDKLAKQKVISFFYGEPTDDKIETSLRRKNLSEYAGTEF